MSAINEFIKTIKVDADVKPLTSKLRELKGTFSSLQIEALTTRSLKDKKELLTKIRDIQKQYSLEVQKEAKEQEKIAKTKKTAESIGKGIRKVGKEYFSTIFGGDLLSGIRDLTKSMIDLKTGVATWSAGTSLVMNRSARELQLQYGLSGSQAYAFRTAGNMLGIDVSNPEDLAFMNSAQREKLSEYMDKYSKWYDRMEQTGLLSRVQDLQIGFQELKQEFSMNFLQWIGNNKDTILGVATGALSVLQWIGDMFSAFVGANYTADNLVGERKVTNVTINSTYTDNSTNGNGMSANDSMISQIKQVALSL